MPFSRSSVPMRLSRPRAFVLASISACARILLGLGIWFLLEPSAAQGQDRGPIVLELPASTRALALGNSFPLGFRDPDAIFYQPGDLVGSQGLSGSMQRYGASSTYTSLSAAREWGSGSLAVGIQHLSYGLEVYDILMENGMVHRPLEPGSLRENGRTAASELVASMAYARTLWGLRVGAVGKFIEERFGGAKGSVGAVDLGVTASPGPLTVGLALQNLGPSLKLGGGEIPLPLRLGLGASTETAWVGPLDLSASGGVTYREGGDLIPSVGLELAYWPVTGRTFVGRLGLRHLPDPETGSPFTFGLGFMGDDLVLDYAYEGFESGDPAHRFSVGWR